VVILLLVIAAIVGLVWTRDLGQAAETDEPAKATTSRKFLSRASAATQKPLVDQRPLLTARRMAAMASTPEEQALAHEAEKVGDHEVDLAFSDAMRAAADNPPKLTPELKDLLDRKNKAEAALKADQEGMQQLNKRLAAAPAAQKDNLNDQIAVATAQMELDQDEFDDAGEDLERAGGDPQAKIKRLLAEHEAGHSDAANATAMAAEANYQAHTLLEVFRAWRQLRAKAAQLEEARQETLAKVQRLNARHETLEKPVEQEKENRENAKQQASGFAKGANASTRENSKAAAKAALESLKHFTDDQKNLADLGQRIQDEQELGDIYSSWIGLVGVRERAALHNMIQAILLILLVVLVVYLAQDVINRLFTGMTAENKRIETLRSVTTFATQVLGAIVILLIVLGVPTQTATILGFVGAGLTVALKDFIVPFFGWFVLMGGNGLRVGDWVEINGVAGEVVEIGLLRTVLMETGNWTDAGHPTGRKVAFPNSFAIEGHFFNFSTSNQWMWDELKLTIPSTQNPYATIDGLQKLVTKETEETAQTAEKDWQNTTSRYRVKTFSAEPAIIVRPTGSGAEVTVRYITRAHERHETRKHLYEAVFELMQGKREPVSS
jgi:small-conductance mechanosensitive channel